MAAAVTLTRFSCLVSRSAPCRVRVNTMVDPSLVTTSAVCVGRSVRSTRQNTCLAAVMSGPAGPTS
ncbi:MAG: hypothetical protein R2715_22330 [Ilumatobacteraceae bacterium]